MCTGGKGRKIRGSFQQHFLCYRYADVRYNEMSTSRSSSPTRGFLPLSLRLFLVFFLSRLSYFPFYIFYYVIRIAAFFENDSI